MLTVTGPRVTTHRRSEHICLCDCGRSTAARIADLRSGRKRSCGCLVRPDITGMEFSQWLALRPLHLVVGGRRRRRWECVCSCGTVGYVSTENLLGGHSRSCGWSHVTYAERKRRAAAAARKHRDGNRQRVLQSERKRRRMDSDRRAASSRRWYARNRTAIAARRAARYWANPEAYRRKALDSFHRNKNKPRITDSQWSEIFNASKSIKRKAK